MQAAKPTIRTMKASDVRQNWSQVLNQVFKQQARIVVEKSGIPVAAVISARDLEWLALFESKWEERFRVVDEIRAAFKDVPEEELEREIAKAVSEARREIREGKRQATAASTTAAGG